MISLTDAQDRLLGLAAPLPAERVALEEAVGRYLSAPLTALRSHPFADVSAMDGYALADPGPWRVTTSIAAQSRTPISLRPGEAARIFTGAPLPTGADRILIQEDAIRDGDLLSTKASPAAGAWVRHQGTDFAEGAALVGAGALVTPPVIALAAMAGHGALDVHCRPAVAIIVTGSELAPAGSGGDALPDSNGPMLAAMVAAVRCACKAPLHVPDDAVTIREALDRAANSDVIVLTGGASVGDHDLVRRALEAGGWRVAFHRIAVKPGKPTMVATRGHQIAIGLPGNPVAAYVIATLLLLPLLRRLGGAAAPLPVITRAPLAGPLGPGDARAQYLRGQRCADGTVRAIGSQDSAALRTLAAADVLIVREINAPGLATGDAADCIAIA